jgi:hypothetical protein
MNDELKRSAQIGRWLWWLAVICLFAVPTSAQTTEPKGIPPGYTTIDGDILMPTSFVESVLRAQRLSPNAPQSAYTAAAWTFGVPPFQIRGIVPFEFDANVTTANQNAMLSAMAVLENVANVDFQQCASNVCIFSNVNFVHIANSTVNSSQVGMAGGEQFININSWGAQFTIVHELMHCLGFYHEQQRPDRDSFVQINCGNVQGGCDGMLFNNNFAVESALIYGNYDFDSVMHYGQCAFSANSTCPTVNGMYPVDGGITIKVLAPNENQQGLIGQGNGLTHLSALDRATVSFLYPFDDWSLLDCTYNGSNGTPNGSFSRPYTTLATALINTPVGGTIWVLKNCTFPSGTYNNQVTIKAAPNVIARFGN